MLATAAKAAGSIRQGRRDLVRRVRRQVRGLSRTRWQGRRGQSALAGASIAALLPGCAEGLRGALLCWSSCHGIAQATLSAAARKLHRAAVAAHLAGYRRQRRQDAQRARLIVE